MGDTFNDRITEPRLYLCDSITTLVNKEFINFTGFTMDELLGKSLIEIGDMLKVDLQMIFDNNTGEYSGFIFTKLLKAKEVDISLSHGKGTNKKVYTFVLKSNSRLADKLTFVEQAFIDDISGVAIYSVPDLVLLKANQKYLDLLDSPFNKEKNSIGKPIKEIVTGFIGTQSEVIFNTVLETQTGSYTKELKFDKFARGIFYLDSKQVPIFENGKMKYIFDTAIEVTKSVLKNKSLERQNKIIKKQRELLKQQKEKLEEQNIQLMRIIENLSEGIMISDNKSKIIMTNPESKRLVYQSDNATTVGDFHKNTKIFDMDGNKILLENFPEARAVKGEKVKNSRMFLSHPDKEYSVEISSTPIYNTNGVLTMVVTCFHDITETIGQSKKIEEQKKELESIIENIAAGISIFDNKGRYILLNKSEREIFSPFYENMENISDWYKQSELYDINGEKIELENIPSFRVMRGEKFKETRMAVKFHHKTLQINVSGTPIYDSEGKFTLGVLCNRDMTNYFKYEEAIRNQYEFMNGMIETFDLSVVRLSCPDLEIVYINKQAFSMIKLLCPNVKSIKQIKDNKIEGLYEIVKPSEYYQSIREVLKEKKTKYLNKQKHVINGTEIYWNVTFEPIFSVNGETQEILIITVDVTPEIKSNINLEKALKSQGEFLVNISHELKTPLNVICATAQLFSMYCASGSLDKKKNSIIKYIDSITQNSYRLSKLINNIVDSSKIEAGFFELHLSNNNIVEVVEETVMSVTNFTTSKGLNIIFDTNTEEKIIACDAEKIERIVLNLISNAIKFSDKGDEIFVDVKDKNELVEISVKDNGIGIEAKYLNMIFDKFKQVDKSLSRNAEGTGIGLSLVKSIAELHGGSICVESEWGKGSKFIVTLPSRKIFHEDMLGNSKIINKDKNIQVEFSDIPS